MTAHPIDSDGTVPDPDPELCASAALDRIALLANLRKAAIVNPEQRLGRTQNGRYVRYSYLRPLERN